jgi:hypothetical protein
MKDTIDKVWGEVALTLGDAVAITWDTCHKIYVVMDEAQFQKMVGYGYDPIIRKETTTTREMLATLQEWFDESCGLKFISAVATVKGDPNKGFDDLIPQGYFDYDEDEDN